MRKTNSGFTLIEVLVAMAILFFVISTMLPMYTIVKQERKVLADRRAITLQLHDELQQIIHYEVDQFPYIKEVTTNVTIQFTFTKTDGRIKGCADWTNEKEKNEQICLYGLARK